MSFTLYSSGLIQKGRHIGLVIINRARSNHNACPVWKPGLEVCVEVNHQQ